MKTLTSLAVAFTISISPAFAAKDWEKASPICMAYGQIYKVVVMSKQSNIAKAAVESLARRAPDPGMEMLIIDTIEKVYSTTFWDNVPPDQAEFSARISCKVNESINAENK